MEFFSFANSTLMDMFNKRKGYMQYTHLLISLNLNINQSSPPVGIPRSLTNLCSASHPASIFQSCWKFANVTPNSKKNGTNNTENYRPRATIFVLSKNMKSMLNHHLVRNLEMNKLISEYGFLKPIQQIIRQCSYQKDTTSPFSVLTRVRFLL